MEPAPAPSRRRRHSSAAPAVPPPPPPLGHKLAHANASTPSCTLRSISTRSRGHASSNAAVSVHSRNAAAAPLAARRARSSVGASGASAEESFSSENALAEGSLAEGSPGPLGGTTPRFGFGFGREPAPPPRAFASRSFLAPLAGDHAAVRIQRHVRGRAARKELRRLAGAAANSKNHDK